MNASIQNTKNGSTHSRTNLGWAAGFLDGEGRIRIVKRNLGIASHAPPYYSLELHIGQDSTRTLEHFQSIMSVPSNLQALRPVPNVVRSKFVLSYRNSNARVVLELLEPYLVRLCAHASLGIEYSRRLGFEGACRKRQLPEALGLREEYFRQFQELNRAA
jgi:hypothetical protein